MPSDIVRNILERIKRPDLLSVLVRDLTGSELNSILLEVFSQRTKTVAPAALLNLYKNNRFVKPSDLPALEMKRMELEILQLLRQFAFEPIELSPVSVLGSCSTVGPVDQKKVLSAIRGTEVLADSTNAIALHICELKQKKMLPTETTRVCNIQRQLRAQEITGKGFTPHFRVGCLVSCGVDTGGFHFEKTALQEHLQVMKALFLDYYKMEQISFRLLRRTGYPETFLIDVADYLMEKNPGTTIIPVPQPEKEIQYYKGIQYKVDISYGGKAYEIADGGFVDWTQQLLQNKKERMFTSGFGFDFMYRIVNGMM